MVKLSSFRIDSKARESGEWQHLGEEFGDVEVFVRGQTDDYSNALNARLRRAARAAATEVAKLPAQDFRKAVIDTAREKLVLDVRGAEDDAGQPLGVEAFKEALGNPDYAEVLDAVLRAAGRVGIATRDDTATAAGNSVARSTES